MRLPCLPIAPTTSPDLGHSAQGMFRWCGPADGLLHDTPADTAGPVARRWPWRPPGHLLDTSWGPWPQLDTCPRNRLLQAFDDWSTESLGKRVVRGFTRRLGRAAS